jgi:hypothetical protein
MMNRYRFLAPAALVVAWSFAVGSASACSLCASLQDRKTFREDAALSKVILYGTITSSKLVPGGGGTSEFSITASIKTDPILGDKKVLELSRYLPVDEKEPTRYLLFADVYKGKLDFFRDTPVKSSEAVEYVKGAAGLDPKDRAKVLRYYFDFLEHSDKEIANDAFLEYAKATDKELGEVAPKLSAEKLRGWLKDSKTPDNRLGMYAFLLGACGGDKDADVLRKLLDDSSDRIRVAYDGILGGYIHLRPREGWDLAMKILQDDKKPFAVRFAVVRTLRFYHNWKPEESKDNLLRGERIILGQGDIADMAIEDLRRWQVWDLTPEVLALHGKKGFDAPILRQAILRYALSCPKSDVAAATFVAERRKQDPDGVKDAEDALTFLKQK